MQYLPLTCVAVMGLFGGGERLKKMCNFSPLAKVSRRLTSEMA